MYKTRRYKTACKRNRAKQTIYAMMGLINYHISVPAEILYPCEIEEFKAILTSLNGILENWQKVASAYAEEN